MSDATAIRVTDEHRQRARELYRDYWLNDKGAEDGLTGVEGIIATALAEQEAAVWEKAAELAKRAPSVEWLVEHFRTQGAQLRGKE